MNFLEKYGPWAVVTGASSGIGRSFALSLAKRGLNLILTARRKERLEELSHELSKKYKIQVKIAVSDLSKENFIIPIRKASEGLEVGLLINNAGYGITGRFSTSSLLLEKDMIHVNCLAPTVLAHEFSEKMLNKRKGGMIFVSSTLAFSPTPFMSSYAATKSYNLYLSEALSYEMKEFGVDVMALCPGTTKSEFADVTKMKAVAAMDSDSVSEYALNTLGKKSVCIPGLKNKALIFLGRFLSRNVRTKMSGLIMKALGRS